MNERIRIKMNERIRELAEQAGLLKVADASLMKKYMPKEIKFAELIVKECARIARNTDLEDVEGGDSAVLQAAGEQIEKHFGVEE